MRSARLVVLPLRIEPHSGLSVRELIEIPYLGTRVHAGRGGLDRRIRFAHACEMPRPWEWLEEGDLLLTSGMGLPHDPREQAAYVSRLADAGLSGIAIGDTDDRPEVSHEMVRAAEQARLPILITAYEVPWVAVIRAVIDANLDEHHERLVKTARIYDHVRAAVAAREAPAALLDSLGRELGCALVVFDSGTGRQLMATADGGGPELQATVSAMLRERAERMPATVPFLVGGTAAIAVPILSSRPSSLVAVPKGRRRTPDLGLLQHVATVVALELERAAAEQARLLRDGAELLAELIDAPVDSATARGRLADRGLDAPAFAIAAWGPPDAVDADDLHERLEHAGWPHLLLRRADATVTLLPDPGAQLDEFASLTDGGAVGLSDAFANPGQASDALRQANWALQGALGRATRVVRYGSSTAPPFMPRTLAEAEGVVALVLGTLLAYDLEHNSDLVHSLRVFLAYNRSWKRASEELYVHKQTLVYRIRRIEELTGRKLDDPTTVAELWLALRTLDHTAGRGAHPSAPATAERGVRGPDSPEGSAPRR